MSGRGGLLRISSRDGGQERRGDGFRTHPPLSGYDQTTTSGASADLVLPLLFCGGAPPPSTTTNRRRPAGPLLTDDHASTRSAATRSTNNKAHHVMTPEYQDL